MLDIGWGELFLIGIVALVVVGPKDLPSLFRTVGNFTGKARAMAREFQRSLEQAANESGMSEVSQSLRSIDRGLDSASNSARKFASSMTRLPDVQKADAPKAETAAAAVPAAPAPVADAGEAAAEPAPAGEAPALAPAGRDPESAA